MRLAGLTLTCLAFTLSIAADLRAQDTTRTDSARYTLPAIGVSVTRDNVPRMAQPLAITKVDPAVQFGTKGYGIDDALRFVPGVLAQSRSGGSDVRLIIRGFGARGAGDRSNSGTSRGVRVLLDGVPETEPDGRTAFDNLDLGLIRGVEVLRSNSSPLWGNAAGGVASFTTLDANDPPGGRAEGMSGSYGLFRGILRADLAVGRGAMAVQGAYTTWNGWREHSAATRTVVNAVTRVPVGERSNLGIIVAATNNEFRIPGPLTQAQVDSAPSMANPTYAARDEHRHNRLFRLAANADHAWDNGASISAMAFATPKYLQRSERNTYRDFTRYHVGGNVVGRVRGRFGDGTRATLSAGLDEAYQDGAILFYNLTPQGTRGDTLRDNKKEGANNAGAFVQADIQAGDRWTFVLGARYDAIRYHSASFIDTSLNDVKTFSGVLPKMGVSYLLSPTHSVYANFGGGVEAPAGNETDPSSTFGQDTVFAINPLLEPVRSATIEVGTRRVLMRNDGALLSLNYDVAFYHTKVKNEIVPYRGGRFYFTAGEARRTGAEFGLSATLRAGFRFDASLALSSSTYSSYVVDSVHYGVPGASADYSGNDIVGVPGTIYAFGAGYTLRGTVPLSLRAVVEGSSAYWIDDANSVEVPAHMLVNLSLGFDQPVSLGAHVGLRGFVTVNNVFDTAYIGSAFLNPDVVGGVPVAFEPGLPRHVVVGLTFTGR